MKDLFFPHLRAYGADEQEPPEDVANHGQGTFGTPLLTPSLRLRTMEKGLWTIEPLVPQLVMVLPAQPTLREC